MKIISFSFLLLSIYTCAAASAQSSSDRANVIAGICTSHGKLAEDLFTRKTGGFVRPETVKGKGVGVKLVNLAIDYSYNNATSVQDAYRIANAECTKIYGELNLTAEKELASVRKSLALTENVGGEQGVVLRTSLENRAHYANLKLLNSHESILKENEKLARTLDDIYLKATLAQIEKELKGPAVTPQSIKDLTNDRERCLNEIKNSVRNAKLEIGRRQWAKKCEEKKL